MPPLTLYTPKPGQALQQAPEIRPAAIDELLGQLSGMQAEDAAQRLLAELGRLNRSELDADLRAKLTLRYEAPIRRLQEELLAALPENGTPQSPMHRHAANLAHELAVELAYAWKLVNQAIQQKRSLFGGAKARQAALLRLMAALSGQICTSYRSYTSPPVCGWHELHQCHAAIVDEGVADTEPADASQAPAAIYKRTLLLALADPFRLTRPEIEVTLAYLDRFGNLAELGKGGKSTFRIDPEADSPAALEAAARENGAAASAAPALDTRALCRQLRSLLLRLQAGESWRDIGLADMPHQVNGAYLLSRLHQAWRGGNKRGFKRYQPGLAHVEMISGLPAIHHLFDEKRKQPAADARGARNGRGGAAEQDMPARWRVVNDSACGLAISAHAQEVVQVRMGNPVALREASAGSAPWLLGVIRWGKMSKGQVVVAGVEKLSPDAVSVVLRFSEGAAAEFGQPALLIPANAALQTAERLLLPQGLYQRGRIAELWHRGTPRRIGLGSLIEQTAFFDLVEMAVA